MNARNSREASVLLAVTNLRIVLVPAVMGLILIGPDHSYAFPLAAILFVLAALTDLLDGFLARRWAVTSALGAFLDTTADKLLVSGALIALVAVGRASPWIAVIIVGRELAILALRGVIAVSGTVMKPSIWGKLKANVQFLAITLAILRYPREIGPLFLDEWVMLAAAAITVISAWGYVTRFSSVLSSPPPR